MKIWESAVITSLALSALVAVGCTGSGGPGAPASPTAPTPVTPQPAPPTSVAVRTATFQSANGYTTSGTAAIVKSGSSHTLELQDDFRTTNNGVLDVRLCNSTNCTSGSDLNLGSIQAHNGRQSYALPNDGAGYIYVVIYCRVVNAAFGFGSLR